MKRWAAVACLWLTFGLVFGVGSRAVAAPVTAPGAVFFRFPEPPPDDLPNGKVPGEKVPGELPSGKVPGEKVPGDDTTTSTTTTTIPGGGDTATSTTTTTIPGGGDTATSTTTTVPASDTTTSTTTTTSVPGGGGVTPPAGDTPGDATPGEGVPAGDVEPVIPGRPTVSFATGEPVATAATTPLEAIAFAFRDVVEELRLNLLPAALLGMFTAVLLLRPLEVRPRGTKGASRG
jgi:hypothetical protein